MTSIELTDEEVLLINNALNNYTPLLGKTANTIDKCNDLRSKLIIAQNQQKVVDEHSIGI
jgi:hypothetical protein